MIDDGGQAYPSWDVPGQLDGPVTRGMSLRDYFAAAALQGLLVSYSGAEKVPTDARLAKQSFNLADAMLLARGEK